MTRIAESKIPSEQSRRFRNSDLSRFAGGDSEVEQLRRTVETDSDSSRGSAEGESEVPVRAARQTEKAIPKSNSEFPQAEEVIPKSNRAASASSKVGMGQCEVQSLIWTAVDNLRHQRTSCPAFIVPLHRHTNFERRKR
jgi:hypothetical protein